MTLDPRGRIVVAYRASLEPGVKLARYSANGTPDATFGTGGVVDVAAVPGYYAGPYPARVVALPDGRIVLVGSVLTGPGSVIYVARFLESGAPDMSFAGAGYVITAQSSMAASDAVALDDGRLLVAGSTASFFYYHAAHPVLVRYRPDGSLDPTFGNAGAVINPPERMGDSESLNSVALLPDGRIIGAGSLAGRPAVWRYLENGSPDLTFGAGGRSVPTGVVAPSYSTALSVLSQENGAIVAGGIVQVRTELGPRRSDLFLLRVGSDGSLDGSFGAGGTTTTVVESSYEDFLSSSGASLLRLSDGRLLVGAARYNGVDQDFVLARYSADGVLDADFGVGGIAVLPAHAGAVAALARQSDGKVIAAGEAGTLALVRYAVEQPAYAVEYHHAGFDHYFVTVAADEIARLDAGALPGWTRTGQHFVVEPPGAVGVDPVCRFFSGARFAPKSSHFYTSAAAECASLQAGADWTFEGDVFGLRSAGANGDCATPFVALYRLYNNGKGGAPNHRFVTDPAARTAMLAQGWIAEGSGIGVAGCVPAG